MGSSLGVGEVVTRSCDVACVEGSAGLAGTASVNTYCCTDDLCNDAVKLNNQLALVVALLVGLAVAARLF